MIVTNQYADNSGDLFDICNCSALFAAQYWMQNRKLISLHEGALGHEQINKVFNWPSWAMCKESVHSVEVAS